MTLYEAFRSAWPGVTPVKEPYGLGLTRRRFVRGDYYDRPKGTHFVVIAGGGFEEILESAGGRDAILAIHNPREVVPNVIGRLRALRETVVIEMGEFWESTLPEASELVKKAKADQLAQTSQRLADAMCDPVTERVHRVAKANPKINNAVLIAKLVGCSREMVSRIAILRARGESA